MLAAVVALSVGVLAACGGTGEDSEHADLAGVAEIVIAERLEADPFCSEMLAIADEELDGPQTAERYRELSPLVPAVLTSDFQALIDTLLEPAGDPILGETDEGIVDIGPDIDDSMVPEVPPEPLSPGEVVSAWVDAHCRATTISPLPQPSAPD